MEQITSLRTDNHASNNDYGCLSNQSCIPMNSDNYLFEDNFRQLLECSPCLEYHLLCRMDSFHRGYLFIYLFI